MREFASDLKRLKQRLEIQEVRVRRPQAARLRIASILTGAAVIIAGGAARYRRTATGRSQHDVPAHAVPPTTFSGFMDYPVLSPDGSRVAFSWNGGHGGRGGKQERNIYVKRVGEGDPVQLTTSA